MGDVENCGHYADETFCLFLPQFSILTDQITVFVIRRQSNYYLKSLGHSNGKKNAERQCSLQNAQRLTKLAQNLETCFVITSLPSNVSNIWSVYKASNHVPILQNLIPRKAPNKIGIEYDSKHSVHCWRVKEAKTSTIETELSMVQFFRLSKSGE